LLTLHYTQANTYGNLPENVQEFGGNVLFFSNEKAFCKECKLEQHETLACCNMKYFTPAGNDGIRQFSRGSELFCAPKRAIYANEQS
jgi:hypothetical protein